MSHSSHDHSHDDHSQNPDLAGNIDIALDESALEAYEHTHPDLAVWTLAQQIDDLANLSSWSTPSVTYSFPIEEADDYIGNNREGTLNAFTAMQAAAAREVIQIIGDLIDLEFIEVEIGSDTDDGPSTGVEAEIRMYNSSLSGTAGGAPAGAGTAGDMWIYNYDADTVDDYDLRPGSYHYHLLLHEMGHILGLSHTSFDNSASGFENRAAYLQDSALFTMMSYNTAGQAGADWDTGYSSTPMIADIAALQSVYGANTETRTEDTVYGFNATANRTAYDFDQQMEDHGRIAAMAVWDAGGIDTLDMSGFHQDAVIDLTQGSSSSVGGHDMNVAIAHGAVIENAVGGGGDDDMRGNEVANQLSGGFGQDTLVGKGGDDTLRGDDVDAPLGTLTHGTLALDGSDSLMHTFDGTDMSQMTLELLISIDPGTSGAQWFSNLPGDAYLVWDPGNNGMWYNSGSGWHKPAINSDAFNDAQLHRISIVYDPENDSVEVYFDGGLVSTFGGTSAPDLELSTEEQIRFNHDGAIADIRVFDTLRSAQEIAQNAFATLDTGTDGLVSYITVDSETGVITDAIAQETIALPAGAQTGQTTFDIFDDTLEGGRGDDDLFGGLGDDILRGGKDDDLLSGGVGADQLFGGTGTDGALFLGSDAAVQIDLASNSASGGDAEGDSLTNIENIQGSEFADQITGNGKANELMGNSGGDTIRGGNADDTLSGNDGRDRLHGNAGNDSLDGGAARDQLKGGKGDDSLSGGSGRDVLIGQSGDDYLLGGSGADHFVFDGNDGNDVIGDFDLTRDALRFTSGLSSDDLTIGAQDGHALVSVGTTSILLENVDEGALSGDHFLFEIA